MDVALTPEAPDLKSEAGKLASETMMLQGHTGEVFTVKFSPCGNYLASAGMD